MAVCFIIFHCLRFLAWIMRWLISFVIQCSIVASDEASRFFCRLSKEVISLILVSKFSSAKKVKMCRTRWLILFNRLSSANCLLFIKVLRVTSQFIFSIFIKQHMIIGLLRVWDRLSLRALSFMERKNVRQRG